MMRRLISLLSLLALAACGRGGAQESAKPEHHEEESHGARELKVPEETQKKWGLVTGPVTRETLTGGVTLPGVIALNQQRSAQISTLLEGKVISLGADLGDQVRAGQALVVLHAPAFAQAQTALLQAHARRNLARREFDRARELMKDEAIQQREYQRRQSELEAATTDYGLAESQLHSYGWGHPEIDALVLKAGRAIGDLSDLVEPTLRVTSPIAGRVIARDVVIGEHVHPDKLLFTVSDLGTLWATLDAREKDLPSLEVGSKVSVVSEVYPDRRFEGRVSRVGDVVDEKLRTIKVRVEVPNPGLLLKPNMFISAVLDGRQAAAREVLAVPDGAIQTVEGEPSVFVTTDDGFALKPVVVGERIGSSRAILQGLDGTERIVIAGAFSLKAEWLKGAFASDEHGHGK